MPVIASFGGVAASGGYYVAAGTDRIFIEPTGFTGSIGVIAQVPTLQEAMSKLGVEWVTLVADGSPKKDNANNLYRDWTEADREVLSRLIDDAYRRFTEVVVAGRPGLTEANVGAVADGSVYTGEAAVANGLVDAVGYLDDAVDSLAEELGVDDPADLRRRRARAQHRRPARPARRGAAEPAGRGPAGAHRRRRDLGRRRPRRPGRAGLGAADVRQRGYAEASGLRRREASCARRARDPMPRPSTNRGLEPIQKGAGRAQHADGSCYQCHSRSARSPATWLPG